MKYKLDLIYRKLFDYFGPQHWWPAESAFEVMVGAILTQNTNWGNVEKAIANLKKENVLSAKKLYRIKLRRLAKIIRPAGYYNIKSRRLKDFLKFFIGDYAADIKKISQVDLSALRNQLLAVKGVGPETADSILLYALNKPVFVVDAYTKRIFSRHGFFNEDASYSLVQEFIMANTDNSVKLFNEYHALLVKLAKEFCLKNKPKCTSCPIKGCFTKNYLR
jgi:endonuclease-3 related protein